MGAFDVVADVLVSQRRTRQAASSTVAPVLIADLEESMVSAAVSVESSDGRRVEVGLVLSYAHPDGYWCVEFGR